MHLAKFFSHRMESTRSSLVSFWLNEVSPFDELDRAELDQGWGINVLGKGEKKMVTFRQLEILFGFTMEKETCGTSRKMNSKDWSQLTRVWWTREGLLQQVGWTSSFARPTSSLSTRSWMGGSNSSSHIHWLDPSKLLLPNPELTTGLGGENIDFRPPVYTLVGHEDLREEEPELDRAEDRAESS
ncbi:unnamed protein product [Microthlaspi erraticum]|uniref:Uncharacterized protein n=1 Tax=Microthlaspi erraticum TaxID=1685480 RepID=A0A6D2JQW4_9BRAS|nr:unnamed protein product [Microthlaspi erraticum]